ncbi:hypothetical protein D3C87_1367460 [compost metagenome]
MLANLARPVPTTNAGFCSRRRLVRHFLRKFSYDEPMAGRQVVRDESNIQWWRVVGVTLLRLSSARKPGLTLGGGCTPRWFEGRRLDRQSPFGFFQGPSCPCALEVADR